MRAATIAVVVTVSLALLIVGIVFLAQQMDAEKRACEAAGGSYEVSHYIPVTSGKTMTMVPVYECRELR